jgi:hypothetical protein
MSTTSFYRFLKENWNESIEFVISEKNTMCKIFKNLAYKSTKYAIYQALMTAITS